MDPRPKWASFSFSPDLTLPTHSQQSSWTIEVLSGQGRACPAAHRLEEAGAGRATCHLQVGQSQSKSQEQAEQCTLDTFSLPHQPKRSFRLSHGGTRKGVARKSKGFFPILPRRCKFLFYGLMGEWGEEKIVLFNDSLQFTQYLFIEPKHLCVPESSSEVKDGVN